MTDVLTELLIIDNFLKNKLDLIRISRNDWIHEMKDIDMVVSNDAIAVAIDLLNVLMPIKISWICKYIMVFGVMFLSRRRYRL